jgi:hypothetical protein
MQNKRTGFSSFFPPEIQTRPTERKGYIRKLDGKVEYFSTDPIKVMLLVILKLL